MDEKIALIQIMIHYLKNKEVVINRPRNMQDILRLNQLHMVAINWGQSVNLQIIK